MKTFKIGDRVTWSSQAAGSLTKKVGTVIDVLAPGFLPRREHMRGMWLGRDHVSYVVEVVPPSKPRYSERTHGKPRPRKAVRYWPIASKLRASKAGAK